MGELYDLIRFYLDLDTRSEINHTLVFLQLSYFLRNHDQHEYPINLYYISYGHDGSSNVVVLVVEHPVCVCVGYCDGNTYDSQNKNVSYIPPVSEEF